MARIIRSKRTYVVNGWTVRVAHPMILGRDYWAVSRPDARTRYYDLLADAKRAATSATIELTGGFGII